MLEDREFGVGYQLKHRFSENWTLSNRFRLLSSDDFDFRLTSWSVEEETEQLDRRWRSNDDLYEDYALQTNVVGKFATGSINHTLLVGDLERETRVGKQSRLPDDPSFLPTFSTQLTMTYPDPTLQI